MDSVPVMCRWLCPGVALTLDFNDPPSLSLCVDSRKFVLSYRSSDNSRRALLRAFNSVKLVDCAANDPFMTSFSLK